VVTGDRDRLLWQALGELSERCQQLLRVLACAPDLSYAEVGRSLRMPIGSIGPTRRRCLDTLRPLVAATGEGGGDQRSDGVASGRAGTR
jgi:DNA-directed RNA polymerase specialized sigma24 family protein